MTRVNITVHTHAKTSWPPLSVYCARKDWKQERRKEDVYFSQTSFTSYLDLLTLQSERWKKNLVAVDTAACFEES